WTERYCARTTCLLAGWHFHIEKGIAHGTAHVVAPASAIAKTADIAVDRHLGRLAIVGTRHDVEGRGLTRQLIQNALAHIECDRIFGTGGLDMREAARAFLPDFSRGASLDGHACGLRRLENGDPFRPARLLAFLQWSNIAFAVQRVVRRPAAQIDKAVIKRIADESRNREHKRR